MLAGILLCGVPVCVNGIHNVMTTPMHVIKYICESNELIEQQKKSTNTRTLLANDEFLLKLPPPSRNCSDTFFDVPSLMEPHMNGTNLMNVSDGCPTLTCLSLKLRRCYFYVISTVSMTLVIIIIN